MTAPVITQAAFRWRNDDGSQTTATWKAAQNTNPASVAVDTNFRMRLGTTVASATATLATQLQYRRTPSGGSPGSWINVTASSSVVRSAASGNVSDSTATTQQMALSGTFNAGQVDTTDGLTASRSVQSTRNTEDEYCVQIRSADVGVGDVVELRATNGGTAYDAYTVTPSITIVAAAPAGAGALALSKATLAGAGAETFSAAGAITLAAATLAASAAETFVGSDTLTLSGISIAATATPAEQTFAVVSWAEAEFAEGEAVAPAGAGALQFGSLTIAASGEEIISGAGAIVLDQGVVSGAADEIATATGAVILDVVTVASSGAETINGSAAIILDDSAIAAMGDASLAQSAGTGAMVFDRLMAAALGQETLSLTSAILVPGIAIDATASSVAPSGVGALVLTPAEISALGSIAIIPPRRKSHRDAAVALAVGGRTNEASGARSNEPFHGGRPRSASGGRSNRSTGRR